MSGKPLEGWTDQAYRGYLIRTSAFRLADEHNRYWVAKDGAFISWADTVDAAKRTIDQLVDYPTDDSRWKDPELQRRTAHYRWCAEHEGKRALLAIQTGDGMKAYHYARDAAYWASRMLNERVKS